MMHRYLCVGDQPGSVALKMKRVVVAVLYVAAGLAFSAFFAARASRLAERCAWPLISTRWHPCFDIEHCEVPWWGYAVIATFILRADRGVGCGGLHPRKAILSARGERLFRRAHCGDGHLPCWVLPGRGSESGRCTPVGSSRSSKSPLLAAAGIRHVGRNLPHDRACTWPCEPRCRVQVGCAERVIGVPRYVRR